MKSKHRITAYDWLAFLIWPFAYLIYRLRFLKTDKTKTVSILFCGFIGLSFIIPENVAGAADSARYAQDLEFMSREYINFSDFLNGLYNIDQDKVRYDIYQPLLTWLVSLFTINPRILFIFFSLVFGWFYVNNLWMIFEKLGEKKNRLINLIIIILALVLPIWLINGARMWTAAHVFIYGVFLSILKNKNKLGLFWVLASGLFHFSFLLPSVIFIIYKLINFDKRLLFITYISTFFISSLDLELVRNSLDFLPDIFQLKVNEYAKESYLEVVKNQGHTKSLNYTIYSTLWDLFIFSSVLVLYYSRYIVANFSSMLKFLLLFGTYAQIASMIPSGGRFLQVFYFLTIGSLVIYLSNVLINKKIKLITDFFIAPCLVYFILFKFRIGAEFLGPYSIIGNPIISLLYEDPVTIFSLTKDIF